MIPNILAGAVQGTTEPFTRMWGHFRKSKFGEESQVSVLGTLYPQYIRDTQLEKLHSVGGSGAKGDGQ